MLFERRGLKRDRDAEFAVDPVQDIREVESFEDRRDIVPGLNRREIDSDDRHEEPPAADRNGPRHAAPRVVLLVERVVVELRTAAELRFVLALRLAVGVRQPGSKPLPHERLCLRLRRSPSGRGNASLASRSHLPVVYPAVPASDDRQ